MPRSLDHIADLKGVAERLKSRRDELGMSQRQLAFPGCTAAYISRLEAAARVPSRQMLDALADRLKTTRRWLETGDDALEIEVPLPVVDGALVRWSFDHDEPVTWDSLDAEERQWIIEAMVRGAIGAVGPMATAIATNRRERIEAIARAEAAVATDAEERLRSAAGEAAPC